MSRFELRCFRPLCAIENKFLKRLKVSLKINLHVMEIQDSRPGTNGTNHEGLRTNIVNP